MDYERKDSNAKAKSGKEPQVLHPYNVKKKMTRREMLFKAMKGAKWNTWADITSQKTHC